MTFIGVIWRCTINFSCECEIYSNSNLYLNNPGNSLWSRQLNWSESDSCNNQLPVWLGHQILFSELPVKESWQTVEDSCWQN